MSEETEEQKRTKLKAAAANIETVAELIEKQARAIARMKETHEANEAELSKMLYTKMKNLVEAGFSEAQAIEIVKTIAEKMHF